MSTYDETGGPLAWTHQSGLNLHRKCEQAWAYRYLEGIGRPSSGITPKRDFGSWYHAARAVYSLARGLRDGTLQHVPQELRTVDGGPVLRLKDGQVEVYVSEDSADRVAAGAPHPSLVIEAAKIWWDDLTDEEKAKWHADFKPTLPEHLRATFVRWLNVYSAETAQEQVLLIEYPFRVTLPSGVRFQGTVDEVYRDKATGLTVVRDIKTQFSLEKNESEGHVFDSQLHLYPWALAQVEGIDLGNLGAIQYDRTRSKSPSEPVLTATGSLSKSATDFDLATYRHWASGPEGQGVPWGVEGDYVKTGKRAGAPKFGHYTEDPAVVAELSTVEAHRKWFYRYMAPVNLNVIKAHIESAESTAERARATTTQWLETGQAPRSLTRTGCGFCDFKQICHAQLIGGPGEYDLSEFGMVQDRPKYVPNVETD